MNSAASGMGLYDQSKLIDLLILELLVFDVGPDWARLPGRTAA